MVILTVACTEAAVFDPTSEDIDSAYFQDTVELAEIPNGGGDEVNIGYYDRAFIGLRCQ